MMGERGKWECCKCLEENGPDEEVCEWCDTLRDDADRVRIKEREAREAAQDRAEPKECQECHGDHDAKGSQSNGGNKVPWEPSEVRPKPEKPKPSEDDTGLSQDAMKAAWAARRRRLVQQLAEIDFCGAEERRSRLRALQLELHPDKHQQGTRLILGSCTSPFLHIYFGYPGTRRHTHTQIDRQIYR